MTTFGEGYFKRPETTDRFSRTEEQLSTRENLMLERMDDGQPPSDEVVNVEMMKQFGTELARIIGDRIREIVEKQQFNELSVDYGAVRTKANHDVIGEIRELDKSFEQDKVSA